MKKCMQKFLTPLESGSILDLEEDGRMAGKHAGWQTPDFNEEGKNRTLRQIRDDLGLTQTELARLLGFSTRWVAAQEASGSRVETGSERRLVEIDRLIEALSRVVQPEGLRGWFVRPNPAFQGLKPIEVVERGQIDRLWQMAWFLESGVAS